jgi:hypothetical protein
MCIPTTIRAPGTDVPWRVGHDKDRLVCYDRRVVADMQQLFAD